MQHTTRLLLPGFGAPPAAYAPGLPSGWIALEPPRFRETRGSFAAYRAWLRSELDPRPGGLVLAGHSMGGALALLAAAAQPERVEHLILISSAGLPLVKPMAVSAAQFAGQVASRRFALRHTYDSLRDVLSAPRSALRVARTVRSLDLTRQMAELRQRGLRITVIGAATDTLVTSLSSRRIADLLAARYVEVPHEGGHMWMFGRWPAFARELSRF